MVNFCNSLLEEVVATKSVNAFKGIFCCSVIHFCLDVDEILSLMSSCLKIGLQSKGVAAADNLSKAGLMLAKTCWLLLQTMSSEDEERELSHHMMTSQHRLTETEQLSSESE
jgi:hypothetical protein